MILILYGSQNLNAFTNPIDTATYRVKVIYLDSMFFEIERGRSCEVLNKKQAEENRKLQREIIAHGEVIRLKESESNHFEEVIDAMQKDFSAFKVIKDEQIHKLKTRIRKLVFVIVGIVVGEAIIVTVVLLAGDND